MVATPWLRTQIEWCYVYVDDMKTPQLKLYISCLSFVRLSGWNDKAAMRQLYQQVTTVDDD